ncbi:MAG: hypothetical protein AB1568_05350 [Thermodesulfobacteriota bacterium]
MAIPDPVRILTSNDYLFRHFAEIGVGDLFVGRLRFRPGEEGLLHDLALRGLICVPSLLSQLLSRSKTLQARILHQFMPPHTHAVHDPHDLRAVVQQGDSRSAWLTKMNGKNGGMGVCYWRSLEDVHTASVLNTLPYPFVLQRFLEGEIVDLRVIVIGDYVEAYRRSSSGSFRHNLHFGGSSQAVALAGDELDLCRAVMKRGRFPYAHLDLLRSDQGLYCSEINLRGGLHGARIGPDEYRQRIEAVHRRLAAEMGGILP